MTDSKYIYVAESGGRYGPATVAELNVWAAEGRVGPGSMIEDLETGREVMAMDIPGFGALRHAPESDHLGAGAEVLGIKNPLPKALLSTFVFGFPPAGLIAVFYAAQVKGLERAGHRERAEAFTENANKWSNWSISMGVAFTLLLLAGAVLQVMRKGQ